MQDHHNGYARKGSKMTNQSGVNDKPVFDMADLMERLDGDMPLAVDLAELFVTDVREKLRGLEKAIEEKSGDDIEKEAHSLKGAASNISAEKVRHLAAGIEAAGSQNDMASVLVSYGLLLDAVEELVDVLKREVIGRGTE